MVRRGALLVAFAALACGPDAAKVVHVREDHCPVGGCVADAGAFDAGPITIPPEPLESWDTTGAGPLSGIFAVETTITARVGVIVTLKQLLRLRIVQKGTDIHEKTTLCAFKLPDVQGVATLQIPPALQTLLAAKATENEGNYISSDAVALAAYTPPPFLVTAGAKLASPATDPLPTMMDPSAAIDEDGDGHPGVTVFANVLTCTSLEQLYVALRTSGSLVGTVQTPDVITGKVDVHYDQSILGFSNDCLATAEKITIDIHPGSPFRAQRVGDEIDLDHNGNVSCPEMVLSADQIFADWSQ